MGHVSARARLIGMVVGALISVVASVPVEARPARGGMSADLDGVPIKLEEVGSWFCDDFSYPAIHCFSSPAKLESRATQILAVQAVDYATVYELPLFAGSYMHISQDYTALFTLGWDDRISSLKGRNGQTSHFYVDWFYGGATYAVCCNSQVGSLGSRDNTFSSVHRN